MTSLILLMGSRPDAGAAQPNPIITFFPFLMIFAIIYFIMIRPQQKQLAQHRKFVDALQNGDKVITESGIFGSIVGVSEDSVILKVAENVKIKVLKAKISGVQPTEEPKGKAPAKKK